jgi:hypothetical protein
LNSNKLFHFSFIISNKLLYWPKLNLIIMKKIFVSAGVISAMFIASCGGDSAVCDCLDLGLSMANEFKAVNGDIEKMTEIADKHASDMAKCEGGWFTIPIAMKEGKSNEELKEMQEEMKGCSSYKEMDESFGPNNQSN